MKILPLILSSFLIFSCSPVQKSIPVRISAPAELLPTADSLITWYQNWNGANLVYSKHVVPAGGLTIRFGGGEQKTGTLIGWIQTGQGERLPLEVISDQRSDIAFFKTNLIRNRLIGLGWITSEDPVYQVTID
ncbi:MAG: hypothetical protein HUU10_01440 [Bacteroidetes bacterium]|nr:hypothetical protein [Bacteroidota bacterium]